MGLLFTLMFLLYQIGCDNIEHGILTKERRYLHQLRKSCLSNERNVRIFESSKSKFKWNLKFIPKADLIKWSGINWMFLSCHVRSRREVWSLSDCSWTRTHNHLTKQSIIWPVWLNGWVFVYELSSCGFESSCSHLKWN